MGTSVQTVINSALLRRLRLRHLELLTVLRDLPTVRGAARQLNLSQPAVSKMLREIEEEGVSSSIECGGVADIRC